MVTAAQSGLIRVNKAEGIEGSRRRLVRFFGYLVSVARPFQKRAREPWDF